jgi:hypothetical protein
MVGKLLKKYFLRELPEGKRERKLQDERVRRENKRTKIEAN